MLNLLACPLTRKSSGAKFDLQALLLGALRSFVAGGRGKRFPQTSEMEKETEERSEGSVEAENGGFETSSPLGKWRKEAGLVLKNGALSPKALELIVSVFRLEVPREMVRFKVEILLQEKKFEEATGVRSTDTS